MVQSFSVFRNIKCKVVRFFVLFGIIMYSNTVSVQAQVSYPVPTKGKNMLFYLQRTFNKNTIVFELNKDENNTLNATHPIKMYWIRYEENNQKADLTSVQQMVFGLKCIPTNSTKTTFLLVNRKIEKLKINLEKTNLGDYKAFMNINNQKTELERVFIKTEENSIGLSINVKYIEVSGISSISNKKNVERILM